MKTKLFLAVLLIALVGMSVALQRQTSPQEPEPLRKAKLRPGQVATVMTSKGTIKFVLYRADTPKTSKNFIKLAKRGFYKGLKFHRVEPWVIQTGDPKGDGTGGSEKTIPMEVREGLGFEAPYMVGMARGEDPNSASSQFFITRDPAPQISLQYTAFGRVFEGEKVVGRIKKGDILKDVKISNPTAEERKMIAEMKPVKPVPPAPPGPPGAPGPPMPPPPAAAPHDDHGHNH